MTPREIADAYIAKCREGFTNEHSHKNWRTHREATIQALPVALRKAVILEWEQATAKVFCTTPSPSEAGGDK